MNPRKLVISDDLKRQFHLWAFHKFYDMDKNNHDLTMRFVRAVVLSGRPVSDAKILQWAKAMDDIAKHRKYNRADPDRRETERIIEHRLGVKVTYRAWEGMECEV